MAHIDEKRTEEGINTIKFIKQIPNILKNAKILNNIKQKNIKLLKLLDNNIVVKLVWDNKKRKWIVTSFKDISKLAETNRTPDIVSNYSEMTPSQTADIINSNKSAAKRLAIWKPMSKPCVDSRFHFTTELCRILNILNTNKIINSRLVKNNMNTKLRKVLLLLLLQQVIKNKKSVNKGQWQTNNNTFNNKISKTQSFQNFENKYPFQKQEQGKFQYLNNRYNSQNIINPNITYSTLSNQTPKLYNERISSPQQLPASGGQSILKTTSNAPISQVQYKNLPEFESLNVKLEDNPVFNFGTTNYSGVSAGSTSGRNNMNELLNFGMELFEQFFSGNTNNVQYDYRTGKRKSYVNNDKQHYEFISK